jgi:pimeloyl-ACP methyl ester carboxylesterase
MTDAVTSFPLSVEESQLADLRFRLDHARWPEAEVVPDWSQGIPLQYTKALADYWRHQYDWRRWEQKLNGFGSYKTEIDGIGIHFLHKRSPHPNALPLIMTHGWPGSLVEFHKVIEPLADPVAFGGDSRDAFHVICPSLPGYGFSDKPDAAGWGIPKIAEAWDMLMARLGYDKYLAQGGDWGSAVTHAIALRENGRCLGVHVNMPIVQADRSNMDDLTPQEKKALESRKHYATWDSGYSKQQSSRPQTLGYGLTDSAIGQLAWIVEKFWAWTDCGEGAARHPENAVTRDEMLDNVMMYWLTASAASSARLYWESFRRQNLAPITLPLGVSLFPKEITGTSRRWAEQRYKNLIYWNEPAKGGHFAALEQPEIFVDEVRKCFRHFR